MLEINDALDTYNMSLYNVVAGRSGRSLLRWHTSSATALRTEDSSTKFTDLTIKAPLFNFCTARFNTEQDSQCRCNVMLWRVRVTIFAPEKQ